MTIRDTTRTTPSPSPAEEDETWQRAHDELVRIAETRTRLDSDEGRWLVVAAREGTHARLGYASFVEYIERLFGYSPRFTLERLRVAEALERLPRTAEALGEGSLTWSAARELTRVAVPETEAKWLAAASGRTVRDVEELVAGHPVGSRPSDPPDAGLRRHVIRLEVSGETLAAFREAMAKLRRDAGAPLDNDAAVLMLARYVLGGPADEGRASYQVSLSVCERCRRGFQSSKGTVVEVDQDVMRMMTCDSQQVGAVDNSTHVGRESEQSEQSRSHAAPREREPGNGAPVRATQSIPPAVRRKVLNRDARRCRVPGCRHAVFLDVHHIEARGDGGGNEPDNLVTLCGAHHRAVHRGVLRIQRDEAGVLEYRHADGSPYGAPRPFVGVVDARAKAFRALRSLGFRDAEVRMALRRAIEKGTSESTAESLLRGALRELVAAA
ncbi:MAG TPA: HNH endonuclease [Polyangiaceae bacterium]